MTFEISSTEESTTYMHLHTRTKSRVKLLQALLFLELYGCLKKEFLFLKTNFSEFFDRWDMILIQDIILEKEKVPAHIRNKRFRLLKEWKLFPAYKTKEEAILLVAGLEISFQNVKQRGHTTTYGWIKHFKDHGHLSLDITPDYFPDWKDLELEILLQMEKSEIRSRIRMFLTSKGKTNLEELFPGFRMALSQKELE